MVFRTLIDSVCRCKGKCWCRCKCNEVKINLILLLLWKMSHTQFLLLLAPIRWMNECMNVKFLLLLFSTFTMGFELDWLMFHNGYLAIKCLSRFLGVTSFLSNIDWEFMSLGMIEGLWSFRSGHWWTMLRCSVLHFQAVLVVSGVTNIVTKQSGSAM